MADHLPQIRQGVDHSWHQQKRSGGKRNSLKEKNDAVSLASRRAQERHLQSNDNRKNSSEEKSKAQKKLLQEKPWLTTRRQIDKHAKPKQWFKTWDSGYYSKKMRPKGLVDILKLEERKNARNWQTTIPIEQNSSTLSEFELLMKQCIDVDMRMARAESELNIAPSSLGSHRSKSDSFDDNVSSVFTTPRSILTRSSRSTPRPEHTTESKSKFSYVTQPRFFGDKFETKEEKAQNVANLGGISPPASPKMSGGPKSKLRKEERRRMRYKRRQDLVNSALFHSTKRFSHSAIESGPWEADPEDDYNEAGIDKFLSDFKRNAYIGPSARVMQALARRMKPRLRFLKWKKTKRRKQKIVLTAWILSFKARRMDRYILRRRYLLRWKQYLVDIIDDREMSQLMCKKMNSNKEGGTVQVFNMFNDNSSGIAFSSDPILRGKQRILENRMGMMKMKYFRKWIKYLKIKKQSWVDAGLCLKRCMRTFSTLMKPMWIGERMALMMRMWYRYTKFKKRERLGLSVPRFDEPLPLWNNWLSNYQARQRRAMNADVRGPKSRILRIFRRWQLFTAFKANNRRKKQLAFDWAAETLLMRYYKIWAVAARGRGRRFRHLRLILYEWHKYAKHQTWRKRNVEKIRSKLEEKIKIKAFSGLKQGVSESQRVAAYGMHLLLNPENAKQAMMVLHIWRGRNIRFIFLRVWKEWRNLIQRRWAWKNALFVYRRSLSRSILRKCWMGWKQQSGKNTQLQYKDDSSESEDDSPMDFITVGQMDKVVYGGNAPEDPINLMKLQSLLLDPKLTNAALTREMNKSINHMVDHLGNTRLHIAVGDCDVEEVKTLLLKGASPYIRNHNGNTPLHIAAPRYNSNFVLIILHLLSCGAPISAKNIEGKTPLQLAPSSVCTRKLMKMHELRIRDGNFTWTELRHFRHKHLDRCDEMHNGLLWRYIARSMVKRKKQNLENISTNYEARGWNVCKTLAEKFLKGERALKSNLHFEMLLEKMYHQIFRRFKRQQKIEKRDELLLRRYEIRLVKEEWNRSSREAFDMTIDTSTIDNTSGIIDDNDSSMDTARLLESSGESASDIEEDSEDAVPVRARESKHDDVSDFDEKFVGLDEANNSDEDDLNSVYHSESDGSNFTCDENENEKENEYKDDYHTVSSCHYGNRKLVKTKKNAIAAALYHNWNEERKRQEMLEQGTPEWSKDLMRMTSFWEAEKNKYTDGTQLLWKECTEIDKYAQLISKEISQQKRFLNQVIEDIVELGKTQVNTRSELKRSQNTYNKTVEDQKNEKEKKENYLAEISEEFPALEKLVQEQIDLQDKCSRDYMRLGHLIAKNPGNQELLEEQIVLEERVQGIMKDLFIQEKERNERRDEIKSVEMQLITLADDMKITRSDYKKKVSELIKSMQTRDIQYQKLKRDVKSIRVGIKAWTRKLEDTFIIKKELSEELHAKEELLSKTEAVISSLNSIGVSGDEDDKYSNTSDNDEKESIDQGSSLGLVPLDVVEVKRDSPQEIKNTRESVKTKRSQIDDTLETRLEKMYEDCADLLFTSERQRFRWLKIDPYTTNMGLVGQALVDKLRTRKKESIAQRNRPNTAPTVELAKHASQRVQRAILPHAGVRPLTTYKTKARKANDEILTKHFKAHLEGNMEILFSDDEFADVQSLDSTDGGDSDTEESDPDPMITPRARVPPRVTRKDLLRAYRFANFVVKSGATKASKYYMRKIRKWRHAMRNCENIQEEDSCDILRDKSNDPVLEGHFHVQCFTIDNTDGWKNVFRGKETSEDEDDADNMQQIVKENALIQNPLGNINKKVKDESNGASVESEGRSNETHEVNRYAEKKNIEVKFGTTLSSLSMRDVLEVNNMKDKYKINPFVQMCQTSYGKDYNTDNIYGISDDIEDILITENAAVTIQKIYRGRHTRLNTAHLLQDVVQDRLTSYSIDDTPFPLPKNEMRDSSFNGSRPSTRMSRLSRFSRPSSRMSSALSILRFGLGNNRDGDEEEFDTDSNYNMSDAERGRMSMQNMIVGRSSMFGISTIIPDHLRNGSSSSDVETGSECDYNGFPSGSTDAQELQLYRGPADELSRLTEESHSMDLSSSMTKNTKDTQHKKNKKKRRSKRRFKDDPLVRNVKFAPEYLQKKGKYFGDNSKKTRSHKPGYSNKDLPRVMVDDWSTIHSDLSIVELALGTPGVRTTRHLRDANPFLNSRKRKSKQSQNNLGLGGKELAYELSHSTRKNKKDFSVGKSEEWYENQVFAAQKATAEATNVWRKTQGASKTLPRKEKQFRVILGISAQAPATTNKRRTLEKFVNSKKLKPNKEWLEEWRARIRIKKRKELMAIQKEIVEREDKVRLRQEKLKKRTEDAKMIKGLPYKTGHENLGKSPKKSNKAPSEFIPYYMRKQMEAEAERNAANDDEVTPYVPYYERKQTEMDLINRVKGGSTSDQMDQVISGGAYGVVLHLSSNFPESQDVIFRDTQFTVNINHTTGSRLGLTQRLKGRFFGNRLQGRPTERLRAEKLRKRKQIAARQATKEMAMLRLASDKIFEKINKRRVLRKLSWMQYAEEDIISFSKECVSAAGELYTYAGGVKASEAIQTLRSFVEKHMEGVHKENANMALQQIISACSAAVSKRISAARALAKQKSIQRAAILASQLSGEADDIIKGDLEREANRKVEKAVAEQMRLLRIKTHTHSRYIGRPRSNNYANDKFSTFPQLSSNNFLKGKNSINLSQKMTFREMPKSSVEVPNYKRHIKYSSAGERLKLLLAGHELQPGNYEFKPDESLSYFQIEGAGLTVPPSDESFAHSLANEVWENFQSRPVSRAVQAAQTELNSSKRFRQDSQIKSNPNSDFHGNATNMIEEAKSLLESTKKKKKRKKSTKAKNKNSTTPIISFSDLSGFSSTDDEAHSPILASKTIEGLSETKNVVDSITASVITSPTDSMSDEHTYSISRETSRNSNDSTVLNMPEGGGENYEDNSSEEYGELAEGSEDEEITTHHSQDPTLIHQEISKVNSKSRQTSRPISRQASRPISRQTSRPISRQTSRPISRQTSRPISRHQPSSNAFELENKTRVDDFSVILKTTPNTTLNIEESRVVQHNGNEEGLLGMKDTQQSQDISGRLNNQHELTTFQKPSNLSPKLPVFSEDVTKHTQMHSNVGGNNLVKRGMNKSKQQRKKKKNRNTHKKNKIHPNKKPTKKQKKRRVSEKTKEVTQKKKDDTKCTTEITNTNNVDTSIGTVNKTILNKGDEVRLTNDEKRHLRIADRRVRRLRKQHKKETRHRNIMSKMKQAKQLAGYLRNQERKKEPGVILCHTVHSVTDNLAMEVPMCEKEEEGFKFIVLAAISGRATPKANNNKGSIKFNLFIPNSKEYTQSEGQKDCRFGENSEDDDNKKTTIALWARVRCRTAASNSFHISVNGEAFPSKSSVWHIPTAHTWEWRRYNRTYNLKSGMNKLIVGGREPLSAICSLWVSIGEYGKEPPDLQQPQRPKSKRGHVEGWTSIEKNKSVDEDGIKDLTYAIAEKDQNDIQNIKTNDSIQAETTQAVHVTPATETEDDTTVIEIVKNENIFENIQDDEKSSSSKTIELVHFPEFLNTEDIANLKPKERIAYRRRDLNRDKTICQIMKYEIDEKHPPMFLPLMAHHVKDSVDNRYCKHRRVRLFEDMPVESVFKKFCHTRSELIQNVPKRSHSTCGFVDSSEESN